MHNCGWFGMIYEDILYGLAIPIVQKINVHKRNVYQEANELYFSPTSPSPSQSINHDKKIKANEKHITGKRMKTNNLTKTKCQNKFRWISVELVNKQ